MNIRSIDAQHQMLFAIGRELYAAMSAGEERRPGEDTGPVEFNTPQCTSRTKRRLVRKLHNYPGFRRAYKAET